MIDYADEMQENGERDLLLGLESRDHCFVFIPHFRDPMVE